MPRNATTIRRRPKYSATWLCVTTTIQSNQQNERKRSGVDMTPWISPIVTVVVAIVGAYIAMKNANNQKFEELKVQNAEQTAMLKTLKEQVEKHNGVIERTFKLESDMHTAYKRIDELKEKDEKLAAKIEKLHG